MKTQTGEIVKIGKGWYGRWYENVIENGQTVRKRRFVKLCDVDDRYRTKADVRPLLAEKLRALNERRTDVRSSLTLATFVSASTTTHMHAKISNPQPFTVTRNSGETPCVLELARFG